MTRRFPRLPDSVFAESRPRLATNKVAPQWSSNTQTTASRPSLPVTKFREPHSLTKPVERSAPSPHTLSAPSLRSSPQPPPMTGPTTRPNTTVGSNLTRPEVRHSAPTELSRPLPKEIGVSTVAGPTDRPAPTTVDRTVDKPDAPPPYQMGGVNRATPVLPFQVSQPVSRPELPPSESLSASASPGRRPEAVTQERSLPNRKDAPRAEIPLQVGSTSVSNRPESVSFPSQKGGKLGEYRSEEMSGPVGTPYKPKPPVVPRRPLRVSDL